jgi:hypothetical protein
MRVLPQVFLGFLPTQLPASFMPSLGPSGLFATDLQLQTSGCAHGASLYLKSLSSPWDPGLRLFPRGTPSLCNKMLCLQEQKRKPSYPLGEVSSVRFWAHLAP